MTWEILTKGVIPWCVFVLVLALPNILAAEAEDGPRVEFTTTVDWEEEEEVRIASAITNVPHYTLTWGLEETEESEGTHFVVEQAAEVGFADPLRIYAGTDTASFRAGLAEGIYYFRVRAMEPDQETIGPWSPPLRVAVAYQSMRQAITFFVVGAVVVLATVILVIAGTRRDRLELRQSDENRNGGDS